jgi:hypothetical protein
MIEVKEYNNSMRELVEEFRLKTFAEGNTSITYEKYDPEKTGKTWCVFIENNLASISVVEPSHYTDDPDIAVRVCRYHILKKYRHSNCGFRMLKPQIDWARSQNYKILYWTHDVENRALNALYQHRKKMTNPEAKLFFDSSWYKEVKLDSRFLFKANPTSKCVQYVYYINLQNDSFIWYPKKSMIQNTLLTHNCISR